MKTETPQSAAQPHLDRGAAKTMPPPHRLKIQAVFVVTGLCMALIGLQAGWLSLTQQEKLAEWAKKQDHPAVPERPSRGLIVDRKGEPLAVNWEVDSLAAFPKRVKYKREMVVALAKVLNHSDRSDLWLQRLSAKLHQPRDFVWIKRYLTPQEVQQLKKAHFLPQNRLLAGDGAGGEFSGLKLLKENARFYPHGALASQVIGSVDMDLEGREGMELVFNRKLRGQIRQHSAVQQALKSAPAVDWKSGLRAALFSGFMKDELGSAGTSEGVNAGEQGSTVRLALDASLQFEIENQLKSSLATTHAKTGMVVVMNALTGELVALAQQPGFDPNQDWSLKARSKLKVLTKKDWDLRRNLALSDGYEPGSTFKAILLAAALEKGFQLSDQLWGGKESLRLQGHRITEAENHENFGWLSLARMIQVSSNVVAAKLALQVGWRDFRAMMVALGFGARTGVGFPGESPGQLPLAHQDASAQGKRAHSSLLLATVGFGHGLLVTPLQMVRAYAAMLNGGWLVTPQWQMAEGCKSAEGERENQGLAAANPSLLPHFPGCQSASSVVRVFSEQTARALRESLGLVTQKGGTGGKAAVPGIEIAGKTGTAQLLDAATGLYSHQRFVASFIGFAKNGELPYVVLTLLSEPQGRYYASETAAPLFREVFQSLANRWLRRVEPAQTLASLAPASTVTAAAKDLPQVVASQVLQGVSGQISDQLTVSQAAPALATFLGLEVFVSGGGVRPPAPAAGGGDLAVMPAVIGLSGREALRLLGPVSLRGVGWVSQQKPAAGTLLKKIDAIELLLKSDPPPATATTPMP